MPDEEFYPAEDDGDTIADKQNLFRQTWNYRPQLTADLKNITSYKQWVPPNVVNGDNFTINYRGGLNSSYYTQTSHLSHLSGTTAQLRHLSTSSLKTS
jgi:hypothetical protein